ncbi:hypothetical protein FRC03_006077 [Tulasnella sp. 419]|nr:hypothetical protein FRC03_006077 [Tulasnella sp. 419]
MAQINSSVVLPAALSVAAIYGISKLLRIGSRDPLLPPGPPTLPVLGNIASLPLTNTYLKFTEWLKTYGGIISVKVGPQTIIVLSDLEAINEILEKNGAVTAERPPLEAMRRFTSPTGTIAFSPYGPRWRKMRKAVVEMIKPSAREQHRPIRIAEISQLLFDTMEDPEGLYYHLQRSGVSMIFAIVAGARLPSGDNTLFKKFFDLWDMIREITEPGNTPPVDVFPFLTYIPDMFVRNWKQRCAIIDQRMQELLSKIANDAEKRLKVDQPNGSYVETMIENAEKWDLDRDDILGVLAGLVIAGTVTTASFLQTVAFLAAAHPQTQRKMHEELDRVVGNDRVPTVDDIPNLPYLNAFLSEVHRFRTNGPLGIPHASQEDVAYKGYLIPKGSTIFLNAWATLHDPNLFDHPDTFDPERFLRSPYGVKEGVEKTISEEALKRLELLHFGAGRRRCVGMPMAIEATALISANLFWAFEFCHLVDDNGDRIEPDLWAFTDGVTNDPLPYKCKIKTRSTRHADIIKQNYSNSTAIFESFERELTAEDREYVDAVRARLQE